MDVYKAIGKRRTIRSFKQSASEEQLRKLLLAGSKAPSGSNVQPWEFIVIDDQKIIEQISEHKYQQTLKMVIDEMALNDSSIIEQIRDIFDSMKVLKHKTGHAMAENLDDKEIVSTQELLTAR